MTIPTRLNGQNIDASWFNDIKTEIEQAALATTAVTADYDVLVTDSFVFVDTTSGAVNVDLPLESQADGKRIVIFLTAGANAVTVRTSVSATLETITQIGEVISFVCDGASWTLEGWYFPDVVRESTAQTLTNKTIDADSNTLSNIDNNEIKAAVGIVESKLTLDYATGTLNTNITTHTGASSAVHGLTGTVVGTSDTQTLSAKTFSDKPVLQDGFDAQGEILFDVETNSQTGTDITLTLPTKGIVKLTSASLVSIDDIADGANEQLIILINDTGADLTVNNSLTKIITGTGANLSFDNQSSLWLVFDSGDTWRVVGGSGAGGSAGDFVEKTLQVTSATTGTFNTTTNGSPIVVTKFWDNSTSEFNYISAASLSIDINSGGDLIDYDTTSLTFNTSDYLEITALYPGTSSLSLAPNKNYVKNADMRVNQDKTNASAAYGVVTLDGGAVLTTVNLLYVDLYEVFHNITTANIEYLSTNQPSGSTGYSIRLEATNAAGVGTEKLQLWHKVEEWAFFKGQTVTVSCKANSNSTSARVALYDGVTVQTGNGHSGTGAKGASAVWETLTLTATVSGSATELLVYPSLAGDGVEATTINTNDFIEIKELKLEFGSNATSFIPNPYDEDLRQCQRYYRRTIIHAAASVAASGDWIFENWSFGEEMRATPTMTYTHLNGSITPAPSGTALQFTGPSTTNATVYETSTGAGDCWFSAELVAEAQL